jgi:calpain-7
MVTLGTGRMSATEEETLGLAGEHDYAVLQMKEIGMQRILLVKNPWCDGMIWRGQQPSVSRRTDQSVSWDELQEVPPKSSELSLGTFWITFEDVIRNFNSLYLNWNPNIFRYRQDHHFSWSIPQAISTGLFTHNPQYLVKSTVGGLVWILLSRHFSTEEHILTTQDKIVQRSLSEAPFISLYVFDGNGERIHLSDNAILRSPFVDSPQTLVKLDIPAETSYTLVIAQEGLTLPKYSFTLSAYSRALVTVDKATNPYSFCKITNSAWSVRTAGGNSSAPTYPSNPQFKLSIATRSNLMILVEANQLDLAVHVKVVLAGGQRVTAVNAQAILGESGEYRRGFALAKISDISPGNYTIVCSTFEPGQTGKFSLRVESSAHCEVVAIANEDAGCLSHPLPPLTFQAGINRILAPIFINRLSRLRIVARLARTGIRVGARPLLKVSLEKGQGPHKVVLGISNHGAFSDTPAGVRIGDVDLSPDMCDHGGIWLVVKRFGSMETVDEVEVEILSDIPVTVGQWGTGTG